MSFLEQVQKWFQGIVCHHGDEHATVTVKDGESLWKIAEDVTGDGKRWQEIADANPEYTWDASHTIHPGEKLKLPADWVR